MKILNVMTLAGLTALLLISQGVDAAFINELHYDNAGSDTGEGVEIAGRAGTSLDGWSIEFYNGSNGSVYANATLSGVIDDEVNGFGAVYFEIAGLQNGSPDGLALVDNSGMVVQFLSYEGSFSATSGAATGISSMDIGVFQPGDNAAGTSLQLTGSGAEPANFTWIGPAAASFGALNAGQVLTAVPAPAGLPLLITALAMAVARRQSGGAAFSASRCSAGSGKPSSNSSTASL